MGKNKEKKNGKITPANWAHVINLISLSILMCVASMKLTWPHLYSKYQC